MGQFNNEDEKKYVSEVKRDIHSKVFIRFDRFIINEMEDDNDLKETSTITVEKGSIISVKNKTGKKATVKIKKASDAKGYQLQYALNQKFKKAKTEDTKKTAITVKKLKKKKTYYFRVRAYKMNGAKKVYGKWSGVKKVRVKK